MTTDGMEFFAAKLSHSQCEKSSGPCFPGLESEATQIDRTDSEPVRVPTG